MLQAPYCDIEAVILAGGESRRFAVPLDNDLAVLKKEKALVPCGGRKLIDIVAENYAKVFHRVTVLANSPMELENANIQVIQDQVNYGSRSSLAGLYNALLVTEAERVCIGACDMPFVHPALLQLLRDYSSERDMLIPLMNQYLQPLPAVYRRTCVPLLRSQMESGNFRILDFFRCVSMDILPEDQLIQAGVTNQTFFNMNTWDDYLHVLAIYSAKTETENSILAGGLYEDTDFDQNETRESSSGGDESNRS